MKALLKSGWQHPRTVHGCFFFNLVRQVVIAVVVAAVVVESNEGIVIVCPFWDLLRSILSLDMKETEEQVF